MRPVEILAAFAIPYLLAWLTATILERRDILPARADEAVVAQNTLGRLAAQQRRALLIYSLPELVFSTAAVLIAVFWLRGTGIDGNVLRWGLVGMAFVRLGLSWPALRALVDGRVVALRGPLRKIQVGQRRALATEDGPIIVLPVERGLFEAYDAGIMVTIYYARHGKRVVGVVPEDGSLVPTGSGTPAVSPVAS